MTNTANGNLTEIRLGRLAIQSGSNPAVREFGRQMVDDHTEANNELALWAAKTSYTLPTEINVDSKRLELQLTALSGQSFDQAYINTMVEDHHKAIAAFETAAKTADNDDLRRWATKMLPTLRHHLVMALAAQGVLSADAKKKPAAK